MLLGEIWVSSQKSHSAIPACICAGTAALVTPFLKGYPVKSLVMDMTITNSTLGTMGFGGRKRDDLLSPLGTSAHQSTGEFIG